MSWMYKMKHMINQIKPGSTNESPFWHKIFYFDSFVLKNLICTKPQLHWVGFKSYDFSVMLDLHCITFQISYISGSNLNQFPRFCKSHAIWMSWVYKMKQISQIRPGSTNESLFWHNYKKIFYFYSFVLQNFDSFVLQYGWAECTKMKHMISQIMPGSTNESLFWHNRLYIVFDILQLLPHIPNHLLPTHISQPLLPWHCTHLVQLARSPLSSYCLLLLAKCKHGVALIFLLNSFIFWLLPINIVLTMDFYFQSFVVTVLPLVVMCLHDGSSWSTICLASTFWLLRQEIMPSIRRLINIPDQLLIPVIHQYSFGFSLDSQVYLFMLPMFYFLILLISLNILDSLWHSDSHFSNIF